MYIKTPVSAIHLTVKDLRDVENASLFLLKLKVLSSELNSWSSAAYALALTFGTRLRRFDRALVRIFRISSMYSLMCKHWRHPYSLLQVKYLVSLDRSSENKGPR
jgi:hypothetical protein